MISERTNGAINGSLLPRYMMTPEMSRYQHQYHTHSQAALGAYRRIPVSIPDKVGRHPFTHQRHTPHHHPHNRQQSPPSTTDYKHENRSQQSPPAAGYKDPNQHNDRSTHESNRKTSPVHTPPPQPLSRPASVDRLLLGKSGEEIVKSSAINGVVEGYTKDSSGISTLVEDELTSTSPTPTADITSSATKRSASTTKSTSSNVMTSTPSKENKMIKNESDKMDNRGSDHNLHHSFHHQQLSRRDLLYRPNTTHHLPCPCRSCYLKYLEVAFAAGHHDMKYHHRRRNHYRSPYRHDENISNRHRVGEDPEDLDDDELWMSQHHQRSGDPIMTVTPSMMIGDMTSPRMSPELGKVKIEASISSSSVIEESSSMEDGEDRDGEERDNSVE